MGTQNDMCILIDDREDQYLTDHLARFGLQVSTVRLDFADLVIESCDGRLIGYERKKLTDLIACMQDRRLAGFQLQGMRGLYDRVEIIVEGLWKPGENDSIEIASNGRWVTLYHRGSGISYRQVDSFLYSQYELAGVPYWRTGSTAETASLYASRYHWWQKDYDLHKSHDSLFSNDPTAQKRGSVTVFNGAPNPVVLMAAQIPGIDAKAWDVGKWFNSPAEMILADVSDWRKVEWTDRKGNVKHFGKEMAKQIVDWLQGYVK